MNLSDFDLNLLVIFDALMREGSATRAAQRVHLSQPAISHALNRLRHICDDPLFLRGPNGLQPTERAQELAPSIRRALCEIQTAFEGPKFDPALSRRSFTIAVQSYATIVMLRNLVERLRREAPGIDLRFWPTTPEDVGRELDSGRVDLVLAEEWAQGTFCSEELLADDLVCAMRRGHPAAAAPLTLQGYAELPHLLISLDRSDKDAIDDVLAKSGRTRRVVMTVPHFFSATIALANSDMVVTVTRRVAEGFNLQGALHISPLPFEMPLQRYRMIWHCRSTEHSPHLWLRKLLKDSMAALEAGTRIAAVSPTV